jgi:putative membrane protein
MMWGWGHGAYGAPFWWGGPPIMIIVYIVIAVAVGALVVFLVRQARRSRGGDSALEVLKRRYASGEINKEEFEEKRRDIQ